MQSHGVRQQMLKTGQGVDWGPNKFIIRLNNEWSVVFHKFSSFSSLTLLLVVQLW